MSRVLPFGPVQHAERVDKRLATARARVALLGQVLRRDTAADGTVTFAIGLHKFENLSQVEDWLDLLRGDDDEAPP